MSKILDNATSHFRKKLSEEMQSVLVPEWGNAKIFFKNTVTLKEQSKLIELATQGKTVEALVETLIVKARNEDGTKMFTIADLPEMRNENAQHDLRLMMVALLDNTGVLVSEDSKSNKGSDKE